jgi:hypothetical protein
MHAAKKRSSLLVKSLNCEQKSFFTLTPENEYLPNTLPKPNFDFKKKKLKSKKIKSI